MTHHWQLVLGILSALLFFPLAAKDGRPSLSLVTMVPLLELEKKLIDNLDDYGKALDHKLQLLRSHIQDMRAENEKAQVDPIHYVSNPLNGLSIIRRLHNDWVGWRKFMEQSVGIVQMRKLNAWWKELPTDEDLSEACEGIVRIQNIHHLHVADIVRGELKGRQYNASMSPADIFVVGNYTNSRNSTFPAAFQWLREVSLLSKEDLVSNQDHIFSPEKEVIRVVTDMHVNAGYFSIALYLMNHWLELFPHDAYFEHAKKALEKIMRNQPDVPFPMPYDLVTDLDVKRLRWICVIAVKRRPPGLLHCSYKSSTTPFLRLAPLKMEQIGLKPYVVLYHDVLSPREITELQNLNRGRIRTARVTGEQATRRIRSGKSFMVKWDSNKMTKRIKRRIEDMSGLDLAGSEQLQMVNYGIGGHFDVHSDYYNTSQNTSRWMSGNRIATVLFYLSDVEQGGETVFPRAGYSVKPRAGTALFWYNLHTDGVGDGYTRHAACPVLVGSKWVMTQWISERMQLFKRPCLSRSVDPGPWIWV